MNQMSGLRTEIFWLLLISMLVSACEAYVPYPRKYAYARIELPSDFGYKQFNETYCPFTFEYPDFGEVSRSMSDSCWADISFPLFDCKWHFSGRNIPASGKTRSEHFEEYRRLIYQHTRKATQIQPTPFEANAGDGVKFEIYGNVGTPQQIFFYDKEEQDIMMMSFYFQTATKNDSLQPVIQFMKKELDHMLESFQWK